MNIVDAAQIIDQRMEANWSTPIGWKNVPAKDYGSGDSMLEKGSVDWIEVELEIDGSRPVEIPITCTRYLAFMTININVKEDTGTRETMAYIDLLSSLFEFKTLSGVRMKELSSVGSYTIHEGWMTTTVQIPFEFDREL